MRGRPFATTSTTSVKCDEYARRHRERPGRWFVSAHIRSRAAQRLDLPHLRPARVRSTPEREPGESG